MLKFLKGIQKEWILIAGGIAFVTIFFPIDESYSSSCSSFISMIWDKFEYQVNDVGELTMINPNCEEEKLTVNVTSLGGGNLSMTLQDEESQGVFKGKIRFVNSEATKPNEIFVRLNDTVFVEYLDTKIKITVTPSPVVNPLTSTITIIKRVINDDGGTLGVNDFGLFVGNKTNVVNGTTISIPAGTNVTIGEEGNSNYTRTPGFVGGSDERCRDSINLTPRTAITCVIENDDNPSVNQGPVPKDPGPVPKDHGPVPKDPESNDLGNSDSNSSEQANSDGTIEKKITYVDENGKFLSLKDFKITVNGTEIGFYENSKSYPNKTKIKLDKEWKIFEKIEIKPSTCKIGQSFEIVTDCTITKKFDWMQVITIIACVVPVGGTTYVLHKNNGNKPDNQSKLQKYAPIKPKNIDLEIQVNVELK